MSSRERWALAAILAYGAALRFTPVPYGLPFLFHPDETHLIMELGKFLGGISQGNIPFDASTFHYPLALIYAVYFGFGLATGRLTAVSDVQSAFLLDDPALHLLGRCMAAAFSVVTLVLTFLVGREVYRSRVGVIAAFLMAVSVADVSSAHWLKQNSTVTMMALAATLGILRASRRDDSIRPWVLGGLLGAAVATRIDLVFVIPLFLIAAVIEPDGRVRSSSLQTLVSRRVLTTLSTAILAHLLVSFQLMQLLARYVTRQPPAFTTRPTGASLIQFLAAGNLAVTLRHNAWFYLTRGLIDTSGTVLAVFVVAGILKAARSHRREELILVSAVGLMLVQLLVFNVYGLHYFSRFMPALMILAASAISGTSSLAPAKVQPWLLAALVASAAAQAVYYSARYVQYAATNVDTRARAREWIYENIPFGTPIAVQKFDEIPAYLPPLNQTRHFATAKLEMIRADSRSSGLALQARLLAYPEDTYAITNLSIEHRWAGARLPLENNYDFERLKASGVRYVVTSSANSPLMEEEAAVQGLLISPSALDKRAFALYDDFMRQLRARATLVADFTPRDAATVERTDSPIDKTIRIYHLQ